MTEFINFLNRSIGVLNIRGLEVEPTLWQALAIVILLFLLVFTLARLRFLYIHWNLGKSSLSFLFYGFLLALIVEGFLIISGRTLLVELFSWKDPPKPISTALDTGREELIKVLGKKDEIEVQKEPEPSFQSVLLDYKKLTSEDAGLVKEYLCKPE